MHADAYALFGFLEKFIFIRVYFSLAAATSKGLFFGKGGRPVLRGVLTPYVYRCMSTFAFAVSLVSTQAGVLLHLLETFP